VVFPLSQEAIDEASKLVVGGVDAGWGAGSAGLSPALMRGGWPSWPYG